MKGLPGMTAPPPVRRQPGAAGQSGTRGGWARRVTLAACLLSGAAAASGSLTVSFPLRGYLISSDAPNRVTLTTPWQEVSAAPQGRPHPLRRGYHAQLAPLRLPLRVPAGTPAGRYAAQVRALLFSCAAGARVCAARTVTLPITLDVRADGRVLTAPLSVTDADLRGGSLRP
ncbi:hypothetical protein [Deinococcus sp. RIT780]|uniref:hypothetical protein n=1 Tax=Deinococcus sp. RIT780 TaxID=2870472 RepID=UPI001C8A4DB0|nr:hypothetical protein [Deinococcus sp. RIT780]MBX8467259.1 hypothetical protein [Deinococcus sp. RIT780]